MYKIEDIGQSIGQVARLWGFVADLGGIYSSLSLIINQYRPSFSECRFFGFRYYWQAIVVFFVLNVPEQWNYVH